MSIEGQVGTELTLVNVSGTAKTAFLAVAVYNKNHEMIGIWTQNVTVSAGGELSVPVTVDITGYSADDVASVKAHLWSSFDDMVPYQAAEAIGL